MDDTRLGAVESQFADIIWKNAPLSSRDLVKLCQQQLEWKKSTTYTVLKKLADKGFLKNEDSTVTALIPREQVQIFESGYVVDKAFGGSLPAFIAAFTQDRKLTAQEADEIQRLIDASRKEDQT